MNKDIEEIVRYRFERAKETHSEAGIMIDSGHYNAAANRLYYACFYAVNAILIKNGLSSAKHSGVRALFNQHFVKNNIVSRNAGELYHELFSIRNDSDYEDFFIIDSKKLEDFYPRVGDFIAEIKQLLV